MRDEKAASESVAPRFRILVVDDNQDIADSTALLLGMLGYDVRTVYHPQKAVQEALDFRPDCILSDIGMPSIDGYQLAGLLRQEESLKGTPLIAITAYHDAERALAAGFDHHLVKPAAPLLLAALLGRMLNVEKRLKEDDQGVQQQGKIVTEVRDLMKEVKEDVREIKEGLKEEVKDLKEELREVKEDVKELKNELLDATEDKGE